MATIWIVFDAVWLFDRLGWRKTLPAKMTDDQKSHWRRVSWELIALFLTVWTWSVLVEKT
jgi:hypothetical protein